eukprot:8988957-Pyramimonas_sp.AAC.1
MTDVYSGRTTLWEKRGNDAADEFAKRGASSHGVEERHYHLWRGLLDLAREPAQWSGEVHALLGDGLAGKDHDDLLEAYLGARAAAEEAPDPAPESVPQSFDAPAQPPAEGWEEFRDAGYNFNGHP